MIKDTQSRILQITFHLGLQRNNFMQYFVMYCAGANSLTALTFDMFEHGQYIKFLLPLLDENMLEEIYLFIATENQNHNGKHINHNILFFENRVLVNTISQFPLYFLYQIMLYHPLLVILRSKAFCTVIRNFSICHRCQIVKDKRIRR